MTKIEYIWIGGNSELRGKTKILESNFRGNLEDVPNWNYDGSSTNQADGDDSEIILKPCRIYSDPFRDRNSYIVLCDTYTKDNKPHKTNTRQLNKPIFDEYKNHHVWFGIEQEFFMINIKNNLPLGFNNDGSAKPQGPYYCSVGTGNCYGREIGEEMLNKCLDIGLNVTGLNFEVAPGQCELQLKDEGIKAADDLIILRYILLRVGEKFNVNIDFAAKPVKGNWNGSGCHVNFSTESMRNTGGYDVIINAMDKLKKKHKEHIDVYGKDNIDRLTGLHETSSMDEFSYGIANRGTSIRIPNSTFIDKKGYFEDRRPSSSMDPYLVLSKLIETIC